MAEGVGGWLLGVVDGTGLISDLFILGLRDGE